LKPLKECDASSIISRELLEEIFDEQDEVERSYLIADCSLRAKELGVLAIFKKLVAERAKVQKEIMKPERRTAAFGITDFSIPPTEDFQNMQCGSWIANDRGVFSLNIMGMEQRACHHPILPICRLSNIQTNEERITLAFKRDWQWKKITVDKDVISSASKIVALSKFGVSVTSENAKNLVKYLNDVENMNSDEIDICSSTSKLGWQGEGFIPYDTDIVFDGDARFKQLFEAIRTQGDEDVWMNHVRELRRTNRAEIKFLLSASFASVLVKIIGCLPFFVDLWGETEGGKSVTLMLAASVWANPDESQYIGDYKSTDTALEVRADVLNNLPVLLDDTSNATKKIVEDFENIIYRLCSGKGKSRSNKDLGANRENSWKACFITNGERPLSGYVNQGGAINRIIEIEAGNHIFKNPQKTANLLKSNYGFAGKKFVKAIKQIGFASIREQYTEMCNKLFQEDKMQKQSMSLACILLADRIATDYIFKDGCYISIEESKDVLIDRAELSESERCYRYLLDQVSMNEFRFDPECQTERWGTIEGGYAVFYPTVFDKLCRAENFSKKSFLSWASRKGVIQTDSKGYPKVQKIDGKPTRAIALNLDDSILSGNDGFTSIRDYDQCELPF
jgi:hypothetical protein